MAQVQVTIAGKSFRMACGDGEEAHLESLAALLDSRIQEMRTSFGEIGDMRLHVMAALTLADEVAERRKRIEELEGEIAKLKALAATGQEESEHADQRMADFMLHTSERIERLTRTLASAPARQS
jgi:cell division protein ZapA